MDNDVGLATRNNQLNVSSLFVRLYLTSIFKHCAGVAGNAPAYALGPLLCGGD